MATQYKTIFPTAWVLSTAESRAIERAAQGITTHSDESGLKTPMTPQIPIRESAPPAALFIQQAGLTTPAKVAFPLNTAGEVSNNEKSTPKRRKDKHVAHGQASDSAAIDAPNRSSTTHSIRGTMRKLLPKFMAEKSSSGSGVSKSETSKSKPQKPHVASVRGGTQSLPPNRQPFTWPKKPQDTAPSSQQNPSVLESVPEGSQIKLTEESLVIAARTTQTSASPYGTAVSRRIQAAYSDEPMTAGTGVSSRSSNYADVPSRLPALSPGYSPMH